MGIPTLLLKGHIVQQKYMSKKEKEDINNLSGIEYIISVLNKKIPEIGYKTVSIKPKIAGDKVFIIKSGTGTGKSSVIPPSLYKAFSQRINRNIAVTQPRILTTKINTEVMAEFYPYMNLGMNLGYNTGIIKLLPTEKGIINMTIGTLLQQLNTLNDEEFMELYGIIIIDEVHERSIDIDMCIYKLKKLLTNNFEHLLCPIIFLMSATISESLFIEYFECPETSFMEFKGETFEINSIFPKYDVPNFINYINETIINIHTENIKDVENNEFSRDIIVFIATESQLKFIVKHIDTYNANAYTNYIVAIKLTSLSFNQVGESYIDLISNIDYINIPKYKIIDNAVSKEILEIVKPSRRVIIATPVAETGITIDSLKYCIDSGFVKIVSFNPELGCDNIVVKNVTKNMAIQRKGRVGRKSIGYWYPCYTEDIFNQLDDENFSEIISNDITIHLLNIIITETNSRLIPKKELTLTQMKTNDKFIVTNKFSDLNEYKLFNTTDLNLSIVDLIEVPPAQSFIYSLEKLYLLGFITQDYLPTISGLYVIKFPKLQIEHIKLLLSSYVYGSYTMDMITIAACLNVGYTNIYENKYKPMNTLHPKVQDDDYPYYYKNIIQDQFIEFILVWDTYSNFINKKENVNIDKIMKWCNDNKLNYDGLLSVSKIRDEILINMISIGFNPFYNSLDLNKGSYNLRNIFLANLQDGVDEIKKIKKCIYAAYYCNILIYDTDESIYYSKHKNIPIVLEKNTLIHANDVMHYSIITSNIVYKKDPETNEFMWNAGVLSIV